MAIAALVAFVVLSGLFPSADPPRVLLGTYYDLAREFFVEAPAKAHEARNWALFGEWHRHPADSYQFWRIQSPLWVYPLAGLFRLFGVSYVTLRWFSLAIAAIGFIGWLRFGRHGVPVPALAAAAVMMACNVFVTQIARSGLVEVALNAAAVFLALTLLAARRHPGWLVASQLVFAAGFFAKAGMLYLLPLMVGWNVWIFLGYVRKGDFPIARYVPIATAALIAVAAGLYIGQPEYQRVLEWNTEHVVTGTNPMAPWYARLDAARVLRSFFIMLPVVGSLSVAGLLVLAHRVVSERGRDPWRLLLLLWTLSAAVTVFVIDEWTLRHTSVVLLPAYLLAAYAIGEGWRSMQPAGPIRLAIGGFVALAILVGAAGQVRVIQDTSYQLRDMAQAVRATIGPEPAVIVGRFAMPVLLETPYDLFYVKRGFNTRVGTLRQLGITHTLRSDPDIVDAYIRRAALPVGPPIIASEVSGLSLSLHQVAPSRVQ